MTDAPALTDRGIDALEAWLAGGPLLPEACEPEERREIIDAHRWYGRAVRLRVALELKAEAEGPRIARWRANMARYATFGGEADRLAFFRAHEARAIARLADRVSPGGRGHTMLTIGAVEVRWHDATAAWAILLAPNAARPHPETLRGVGIVALWMLARDTDGLGAEAEIAEAVNL
jgi:hypothetical protein